MCQVKPVVVENKNAAPPPGPSEDKTDPKGTKGKRVTKQALQDPPAVGKSLSCYYSPAGLDQRCAWADQHTQSAH